jgi:hypothetical protein
MGVLAISSPLAELRLIHFGEWIVTRRASPPRVGRKPRGAMVFLADFDGDLDEYLAVFGLVVSPGMKMIFGTTDGFPQPKPTRQLIDYVESRQSPEQVEWSAYPGATMLDVDAALALYREVQERRERAPGTDVLAGIQSDPVLLKLLARAPEAQVPSFWKALYMRLFTRATVVPLTIVTPLPPARTDEIRGRLEALGQRRPPLFGNVDGAHVGRVALLPEPGPTVEGGDALNLLVALRLDRLGGDPVERLVKGLGPLADQVWDGCDGYPGADDPAGLGAWLRDHRLPSALFLAPRSGASVDVVKEALALWEEAMTRAAPAVP